MTVFLLLLHGFLRELSAALDDLAVGAITLAASYLLLLAVLLLPPSDRAAGDQTTG